MQLMLIPKGLCEEIERMLREHDGLDFRKLQDHNTSFMMKLGFKLLADSRAFWVQDLSLVLILGHSWLYLDYLLSDMVLMDGTWNLELFRIWIPKIVICKIIGIPPPHSGAGVDRIIWGGLKIERVHRGMGHSSNCGVCGHSFEDALHVLKDCPVARYIWNLFIPTERLISWAKLVLMIEKSYLNSRRDMTLRFDLSESWVSLNTDGSVRIEDDSGLCKVVRPCIGADACPLSEGQGNCDLMIGEPMTEALRNGGRNYNGSKIVKFLVRPPVPGQKDTMKFPWIGFGLFLRSLGGRRRRPPFRGPSH
ncbi:hypothetical protein Gotri_012420 [Gossypium trilobum]|uniref:Reverse transcriptase zinc-binding domain-containing protein n=1 Tax=Gossypium trilobum TaxID=34281 RepID=A0A7J9DQF1_9ROSI|nr:hypothetical protein [Gossypium trilobum]